LKKNIKELNMTDNVGALYDVFTIFVAGVFLYKILIEKKTLFKKNKKLDYLLVVIVIIAIIAKCSSLFEYLA
jgi:hypothetical protein